ncbi:MAG: hypothetical protein MMC33_008162 [Icmadophila ericetorum]|nr:hypothetical protein [Icmadophila ericetorum]
MPAPPEESRLEVILVDDAVTRVEGGKVIEESLIVPIAEFSDVWLYAEEVVRLSNVEEGVRVLLELPKTFPEAEEAGERPELEREAAGDLEKMLEVSAIICIDESPDVLMNIPDGRVDTPADGDEAPDDIADTPGEKLDVEDTIVGSENWPESDGSGEDVCETAEFESIEDKTSKIEVGELIGG